MPESCQCLNLHKYSCRLVSKQIVSLCSKYTKEESAISIINNVEDEPELKTFQGMKKRYVLPSTMQYDVLEECLTIWKKLKDDESFSIERAEKFEIFHFLIKYFCLDKNSKWSYEVKPNSAWVWYKLLILLKPNLTRFKAFKSLCNNMLQEILLNMTNVVSIELNSVEPIEFRIIGQYSSQLKELTISETVISETFAQYLCFGDFEKIVVNSICNTLDTISAKVTKKGMLVLLENVKSLRMVTYRDRITHHYLVSGAAVNEQNIFPCSLELAVVDLSEGTIIADVYRDYQKLKHLLLANFQRLHNIIPNSNIITLALIPPRNQPELPMLEISASWENLQELLLAFSKNKPGDINVVSIAKNCPNLTKLYLIGCNEKNGQSCRFENLTELFMLNQTFDNLLCLRAGASTVKTLRLFEDDTNKVFEETSVFKTLMSTAYPCLEFLEYTGNITTTKESIVNFLDYFPKLKSFGVIKDEDLLADAVQECVDNNWNLEINKTAQAFPLFDFVNNQ